MDVQRRGLEQPKQSSLVRLGGQTAVEIHREVLVQNDSDVTGAGLHFRRSPSRDARNLGSDDLLELCYRTIVQGNFIEPRAALFQFGRQLIAQGHQAAKVPGANGCGIDSGTQLQGIRHWLVRGADPNRSPLGYGEAYQREARKQEYEQ